MILTCLFCCQVSLINMVTLLNGESLALPERPQPPDLDEQARIQRIMQYRNRPLQQQKQ
jgi:hypothetical protein